MILELSNLYCIPSQKNAFFLAMVLGNIKCLYVFVTACQVWFFFTVKLLIGSSNILTVLEEGTSISEGEIANWKKI